jgi:flagellar protein FliO/FliZ
VLWRSAGTKLNMTAFDWIRAVAALALTLGLLFGVALVARRYGLMQGVAPIGNKGRLRIIEQLWLDAGRTRAVIVRCDGIDHLLVVSPTGTRAIATTHAIAIDEALPTDPSVQNPT